MQCRSQMFQAKRQSYRSIKMFTYNKCAPVNVLCIKMIINRNCTCEASMYTFLHKENMHLRVFSKNKMLMYKLISVTVFFA